jgi:MoxR-like ATPase
MKVEMEILKSHAHADPLESLDKVLSLKQIQNLQAEVMTVHLDDALLEYMVEVTHSTRSDNRLRLGVSPRGSLMLSRAAQAAAFVQRRDFVLPDDVLWLAPAVLAHRLILTGPIQHDDVSKRQIVDDILQRIKIPV